MNPELTCNAAGLAPLSPGLKACAQQLQDGPPHGSVAASTRSSSQSAVDVSAIARASEGILVAAQACVASPSIPELHQRSRRTKGYGGKRLCFPRKWRFKKLVSVVVALVPANSTSMQGPGLYTTQSRPTPKGHASTRVAAVGTAAAESVGICALMHLRALKVLAASFLEAAISSKTSRMLHSLSWAHWRTGR